ncbi:MAG: hypothetical protein CV090_15195 [Nitrospira sp. WS238]|nr:hypothetical protein [Nitrospira sp. WS238]
MIVVLLPLVGCTKPIQKSTRVSSAPRVPVDTYSLRQSSPPDQPQASSPTEPRPAYRTTSLPSRSAVVQTAARLIGARTITSQGRQIAYDCAGVTRAVFLEHGMDVYQTGDRNMNVNGVRLIYNHVSQHGVLHRRPDVRPGDLVFFDNTWDFNGDGEPNDPLTHIGIVEEIEPDGTVIFISRVANAIERYRMNLEQPHIHKTTDGRVLNDYIRRKRPTDPGDTARLTGELFAFYGNLLSPGKDHLEDDMGIQAEDR